MFWPENCNAVRETTGAGRIGGGAPATDSSRVSDREAVAGGVLSASGLPRPARCAGDRGKPDQNAFIERFNRTYRTEMLDAYLFESLAEVRALTERWLISYNQERPHDSLGRVPPLTFLPRLTLPEQSPFAVST